jgi:hypothetical protein
MLYVHNVIEDIYEHKIMAMHDFKVTDVTTFTNNSQFAELVQ